MSINTTHVLVRSKDSRHPSDWRGREGEIEIERASERERERERDLGYTCIHYTIPHGISIITISIAIINTVNGAY